MCVHLSTSQAIVYFVHATGFIPFGVGGHKVWLTPQCLVCVVGSSWVGVDVDKLSG